MKRSGLLYFAFPLLTNLLVSKNSTAQTNEVYLNQGELSNNCILLEQQRILISAGSELSFWDIDKSLLLKSYSAGNQFTGGLLKTQTPLAVSANGNFLACFTADSIFVYKVKTQERVKAIAYRQIFGNNFFAAFSGDEKTFIVAGSPVIGAPNIVIWSTSDWSLMDVSNLNTKLKDNIGTNFTVAGNRLFISSNGGQSTIAMADLGAKNPEPVVLPIDSMPARLQNEWKKFFSFDNGAKLVIYSDDVINRQTWVSVYDVEKRKTIRTWLLPFQSEHCFEDLKRGWLVFAEEDVFVKDPEKGYPCQVLNIFSGLHYSVRFPDILKEKSGYYTISYDDYLLKDGQFFVRSSVTNKIDGINLASGKTFSINAYLKLDRMFVDENQIMYRTKDDYQKHQYTLLNTTTILSQEMPVSGDFLMLGPMSITQSIGLIQHEKPGRYLLSKPPAGKLPVPYKLIQTRTTALYPQPVGRSGNEYVFKLGSPAVIDMAQSEFGDIYPGTTMSELFNQKKIKYLIYNMQNGKPEFSDQYIGFEDITRDEGYFNVQYVASPYGVQIPGSASLINNADASVFARLDSLSLNKFLGDDAGSLNLVSQVHFNEGRSSAIFHINEEIFLAKRKGQLLTEVLKSRVTSGNYYISIDNIGFCNNGNNIYCLYSINNQLALQVLDLYLKPVFNYVSTYERGFIKISASTNAFLIADLSKNETGLHFADKTESKIFPFKRQKFLGQNLAADFSDSGNTFFTYEDGGNLSVYKTIDGSLIYQDSIYNIKPIGIKKDRYFDFVNAGGIPVVLDFATKTSKSFNHPGLNAKPVDYILTPYADSVLVTTGPNSVEFWDTKSASLLRTLLLVDSSNIFSINPSGYYSTGKSNIDGVLLRQDTTVSPIQQRDLFFNKPSEFIKPVDAGSKALKDAFEAAYKKRLRHYGLDSEKPVPAFNKGKIFCNISNAGQLSAFTTNDQLKLDISLKSTDQPLSRLHILVNGVPLYGKNGLPVKAARNLDIPVTLRLSGGPNQIQVFATDGSGQSSNLVPLFAEYHSEKNITSKLHFIGIGINHFADNSHNLNWSVKDIHDLALKFKKKYGVNCSIDTLFNKDVTIGKIAALKKQLLLTGVNDKVIIAYSGHGLLSKAYDYYLSTYSVNFNKPEQGGLPYDVLENLLDSIPARKKLMLIDACHSGEVDKEEMAHYRQATDSLDKNKIKRGATLENTDSTRVGMLNSFELMQQLFANVGRNTGATIISAAQGTQYALEKNDLQNGVFTYSLLENMQQNPHENISDLKQYVNKRVTELTAGMQVPTTRNETDVVDWEVW